MTRARRREAPPVPGVDRARAEQAIADFLDALGLAGRRVVVDGSIGRLEALDLERGLRLAADVGGERWIPLETTVSVREA